MRRKTMTESMRRNFLFDARLLRVFLNDVPDGHPRKPRPALLIQEHRVSSLAMFNMGWSNFREIFFKCISCRCSDWHDTFFRPFAKELHQSIGKIELRQSQCGCLRNSGASSIQKFENRAIANSFRR